MGGGMEGGYLPHIINSSLVGLHCTLLSRWYTALDTKEAARWTRHSCWCETGLVSWRARTPAWCGCYCPTGVTLVGFPWRWKSPAVGWSRPVAPLTAASHILRKAWALEEKPLCGRSPQYLIQLKHIDSAIMLSTNISFQICQFAAFHLSNRKQLDSRYLHSLKSTQQH
jgi:hypothetical protein